MTRSRFALALMTLPLSLAACGPGGEETEPTTMMQAEPLDMGLDLVEDMPVEEPDQEDVDPEPKNDPNAPIVMCRASQTACGQKCTDLQTDVDHCGECGNSCGLGSSCLDGECLCFASSKTWCGESACVDLQADRRHCGECGNACGRGEYCDKGTCTNDGVFGEVIALTNQARMTARDCGGTWMVAVGPLSNNIHLAEAAQTHAEDMAARNYFAHDTPDGVTPTQRMRAAGYTGGTTGENIAAGQRSPEAVVQAWIDSPGHCRNMMSPGYTEIGIGYHPEGRQQPYWVQNFGRP